jgi:hypothetical protein
VRVVVVCLWALALVGVGWASGVSERVPTVRCAVFVGPDAASAAAWRPKRVVLGVAAVPPVYIPQTTASDHADWPYWSKSGLVIRANSPVVEVTVPRRWRTRVAIAWGHTGPVSAVRIAPCDGDNAIPGWNPYAGGFFLRSRAACVPLVVRVGARTATVRFGVGKRCA